MLRKHKSWISWRDTLLFHFWVGKLFLTHRNWAPFLTSYLVWGYFLNRSAVPLEEQTYEKSVSPRAESVNSCWKICENESRAREHLGFKLSWWVTGPSLLWCHQDNLFIAWQTSACFQLGLNPFLAIFPTCKKMDLVQAESSSLQLWNKNILCCAAIKTNMC